MTRGALVALATAPLLALGGACKTQETRIDLIVPALDGGACDTFTDLACVNFLEFTVLGPTAANSRCVKVDVPLTNLCDVANLADGRELFKLPPETMLSIQVEGKRIFPPTCGTSQCEKRVFRGETAEVRIGDYVGRSLELRLTMVGGCGESEHFFFLPDGGTCAEVCGAQSNVLCDGVAMGCLCRPRDGGQGGID